MAKQEARHKFHWEINSLIIRDGTYFGSGWVFHEELVIKEVRLEVRFMNGERRFIAASFGRARDDVSAYYAKFSTAKHSGFFLLGGCDQVSNTAGDIFLQVTLEDGWVTELPVPQSCITSFGVDEIAGGSVSMHQFVTAFKRGLYLIKSFQITSLLAKARRYLGNRRVSLLEKGDAVRAILSASELSNIILVIDHDLGGGANHYRERLVTEKVKEGATVLIFSSYVATLSYVLMVRNNHRNERFAIPGYDFLPALADQVQIKEIIYNTGATFVHPEKLPPLIIELKSKCHSRLMLLVHDYFMVCPSHFLLNDVGSHCGIPDISRCQTCLVDNQQDYSSLYQSRNMVQWRTLWGAVIRIADEIRTFSGSSLKLLQKAYPGLDPSKVVVKPHSVAYMKHGKVKPSYTAALKIGVVGQIGYHKGAGVVRELAREIKARGLSIQIVVIGTIDALCEPSVVSETGPYQHDKLPELIERSGVNIMLFPSIWPETFSYVVQELIELDLPVACFDLGAPVERLSLYSKGMILKKTTASVILDDLIIFHQRVYPRTEDDYTA